MTFRRIVISACPFVAFSLVAPCVAGLWYWKYGWKRPPTSLLYFNLSIWPTGAFGSERQDWDNWQYTIGGNVLLFALIGLGVALLAQRHPRLIWLIYGVLLLALLFPFGWQPLVSHFDLVRQHPTALVDLRWKVIFCVAIVFAVPFLAVLASSRPNSSR